MKILLDTNFIITCVKQKIDFDSLANELFDEPIEWLVPEEVISELKDLKEKKKMKVIDKNAINLSLEILDNLNPEIIKPNSNNPNIDISIVDYIKERDIVLASLDKKLKKRVGNKILTIRGKKSLEII